MDYDYEKISSVQKHDDFFRTGSFINALIDRNIAFIGYFFRILILMNSYLFIMLFSMLFLYPDWVLL